MRVARIPARLSFAAIKESAWLQSRGSPGQAPGRKAGNLRDSSSLVAFAPRVECGFAVFVGKRAAQLLKIGASGPARGRNAMATKTPSEGASGENEAGSSPGGARAIHRF